jgi:CHASE2 domain-containing sensor protein/serine/threonine protein kinase
MATTTDKPITWRSFTTRKLQISLLACCALSAGWLASQPPAWLASWEYRLQSVFFEVRGPIAPPDNMVILAIDDASLSQGANDPTDPQNVAALTPIQTWPWRRQAYAQVIERLMQAGAKAVAIDVLFTTPSLYGEADDQLLQQTLARYGDRVILASKYTNAENLQGHVLQYVEPLPQLLGDRQTTGFINLPVEADGRIHNSGQRFLRKLMQESDAAALFPTQPPRSFAEATLQAAQGKPLQPPIGKSADYVTFHGPDQTFPRIPFWNVLDPNSWQTSLANGQVFRDKIVLIGSTAPSQQDQQPAPFGNSWGYPAPLYGVEIQANALATLQMAGGIQDLWAQGWLNALWVGTIVGTGGCWVMLRKTPLRQIVHLGLSVACVGGLSYGLFGIAHRVVPVATPLLGLGLGGGMGILAELARHQQQAKRLRTTLKSHLTVPLVRAIVDQQDDLRDLLEEREQEVRGCVLGGRYEVLRLIGQGGFGETYLAQDLQRPGQPECVVKQLKLKPLPSQTMTSAHRLFIQEAAALEQLGGHDRIPHLLAYFEEMGEFYLVQELIQGMSLHHELAIERRLSIGCVMHLLQDVLQVLEFVHAHDMIHRDIKPSNLMHRRSDGHWVLIDFGIAKQMDPLLAGQPQPTIGVGTRGYVPPEQALGHPNCTSDLYALGMTAIEALTGNTILELLEAGGDHWTMAAPPLSQAFTTFLQRLTHDNEHKRQVSATVALKELQQLPEMQDRVLAQDSLELLGVQALARRKLHPDKSQKIDEITSTSDADQIETVVLSNAQLNQVNPDTK